MNFQRLFFAFVSVMFVLFGCGSDEDEIEPGEQVVVEKWIDPKDIGKTYSVKIEDIKFGETYTLDTGERVTLRDHGGDFVKISDDGSIQFFSEVPVLDDNGEPEMVGGRPLMKGGVLFGTIVPEGPPIVAIFVGQEANAAERARGLNFVDIQITAENNVRDTLPVSYHIRIDRVLDYNLPIYIEYQGQDRQGLGGGVERARFITIVKKGKTVAEYVAVRRDKYMTDEIFIQEADYSHTPLRYEKASVSILPYTEMEKLDLPITVNVNPYDLTPEEMLIPEGHKFRPYRIHSSSFLMGQREIESDW